ncbi:serine protease [Actinophytocola sp.]|jgi:hypothetical protein|uniref:trypsin-like serine peptidase n=1 Tax=Actinophytocola sp. TaxID=1872138 RepID=UPI002EDB25F9
MVQQDVLTEILSFGKDLDGIAGELAAEPAAVVRKVAPGRAGYGADTDVVGGHAERLPAIEVASRRALEDFVGPAQNAVEKVARQGPDTHLTAEETVALEAIVLPMARPAILIQDGSFFKPPNPWTDDLERHRATIETVCRSVGRIEVDGHPAIDWVGTGWLAAPGVVMTNRHVANEFATASGAGWTFTSGMTARTDFNEELSAGVPRELKLTEIIGIHAELDLALLACDSGDGVAPLPISAAPTGTGAKVYVVGYPAADSRRNDPDEMQRIFAGIYNVKRLQPGAVRSLDGRQFVHDCSTLGGNSGSCVVDLETAQVVGLHFGGRYLKGNYAVALWELADDPLLTSAGVRLSA